MIASTLGASAGAQSGTSAPSAQPVFEVGDLAFAAGAALATFGASTIDRPAADFVRTHGQESATIQRTSHVLETIALRRAVRGAGPVTASASRAFSSKVHR